MNQSRTPGSQRESDDLEQARRLAVLAPHDPDLRLSLARKLLDCWFTDEAVDQIRAVIAMAPNHLEARKLLQRALELQPSSGPRS